LRNALALLGALLLLATSGCAPGADVGAQHAAPLQAVDPPLVGAGENWDVIVFIYDGLPLSGEGPFVGVPAATGGAILFAPGFVVGFPLALFVLPFGTKAAAATPFYVGMGFGALGYGLVGGPFWIVKEIAWDAPCAFGRCLNLHLRSRRGRVDYLVNHLQGWDEPLQAAAGRRLEKLTGEKPRLVNDWIIWWDRHRAEFDKNMKRVKPQEPAPSGR
jgi:hypothetical protein